VRWIRAALRAAARCLPRLSLIVTALGFGIVSWAAGAHAAPGSTVAGATSGVTPLTFGVPVSVTGAAGASVDFSLEIPANTPSLQVKASGGKGRVALYVNRGSLPDFRLADCFGEPDCAWVSPAPGTYFIRVTGHESFAGVELWTGAVMVSPLALRTPMSARIEANSIAYFSVSVPDPAVWVHVKVTMGADDMVYAVREGNLPIKRISHTLELVANCSGQGTRVLAECLRTRPAPATYYIRVASATTAADVQIETVPLNVRPLTLGSPVPISGVAGSRAYFSLEVPPDTPGVQFTTSGNASGVDLYVDYLWMPDITQTFRHCRSRGSVPSERCQWLDPVPGTYYVVVHGVSDFSNASLEASLDLRTFFSLSMSGSTVPVLGGSTMVSLSTTPRVAPWTATSSVPWLTVAPSSGVGPGNVRMTALPADGPAPRRASVTIAGETLTVYQNGLIDLQIDDPHTRVESWTVNRTGGARVIGLKAALPSASWTAESSASWISVFPSSGRGSDAVTLTADAHTTSAQPRTATVTVAGRTISVTQDGAIPALSLSTYHWQPSAAGDRRQIQVTSSLNDGIWWTSSDASWVSVAQFGGRGSQSITVRAAANNRTRLTRVATVTIGNEVVLVTQPPLDVPSGVTVSSVNKNTVTLAWQWAGPPPDGYVLKGGLARLQTLASIPTGSAEPTFTFEAPSGIFYVRVAAIRGGVELPASDDVRVVVNTPARPAAPTRLLGLMTGAGLTLSWQNSVDGDPISGLVLDVTGAATLSVPLGVTERFTFGAIPPGTYQFRVRAVNESGSSVSSNATSLTFPGGCRAFSVPAPVAGLQVYRVGNVITVRWTPPSFGAAVDDYVLVISGAASMTLPMTSREISSPAPPGTYTFTVAARNACGTGVFFDPQSITVP
jgi:hypothetical protein